MERNYNATLTGGELSPAFIAEDCCVDDGMSFLSLLNSNPQKILFPSIDKTHFTSLEHPYGTSSQISDLANFGEYFPAINAGDVKLKITGFVDHSKLKTSKNEVFNKENFNEYVSTEPYNIISNSSHSSFRTHHPRSLENFLDDFALAESSKKRVKSFTQAPQTDPYDVIKNFQISASRFGQYKRMAESNRPAANALARQRRQKISEKTRCLQKMLPWDKKMDTATMLEETYKYVQFLQAQVRVLQSMPCGSSSGLEMRNDGNASVLCGVFGKLNRQQLLEVLLNSPVVQTMMYSQGCCIYSAEQLVLLNKFAEMKALYQQMMVFDPSLIS